MSGGKKTNYGLFHPTHFFVRSVTNLITNITGFYSKDNNGTCQVWYIFRLDLVCPFDYTAFAVSGKVGYP